MFDREDNDGHYEPGNIRFVTAQESADNRRPRCTELTVEERLRRLAQKPRLLGIGYYRGNGIEIKIGDRFGVRTVIDGPFTDKGVSWLVLCDCGNESVVRHARLAGTTSCNVCRVARGDLVISEAGRASRRAHYAARRDSTYDAWVLEHHAQMREARLRHKLTLKQVSKECSVSLSQLSSLELGRLSVAMPKLAVVVQYYRELHMLNGRAVT